MNNVIRRIKICAVVGFFAVSMVGCVTSAPAYSEVRRVHGFRGHSQLPPVAGEPDFAAPQTIGGPAGGEPARQDLLRVVERQEKLIRILKTRIAKLEEKIGR